MSCLFVLPPPTLCLLLSIYLEAHSWKVFLCRKTPPPPPLQLPFSAHKMQVKGDFFLGMWGWGGGWWESVCVCVWYERRFFPRYVGVGGWMVGECVCVCVV